MLQQMLTLTCPICNIQSDFKIFYEFNYICKNCGFRFDDIKLKFKEEDNEQDPNKRFE